MNCEMQKCLLDGEMQVHITIQENIKEDELFLLAGEVIKNCTPLTDEICKSMQDKVIASSDSDLNLPTISAEDLEWFYSKKQDILKITVEIGLSCCVRKTMGHWCVSCETRSGFGKYLIPGDEVVIYKE